jgi:hypothetical protein
MATVGLIDTFSAEKRREFTKSLSQGGRPAVLPPDGTDDFLTR